MTRSSNSDPATELLSGVEATSGWLRQGFTTPGDGRAVYVLAQHEESHAEEHPAEAGHADPHAAEDGHAPAGAHGKSKVYRDGGMPAEFPNVATLIMAARQGKDEHHGEHHMPWYVFPAFAIFNGGVFLLVIAWILRKRSIENPSRAQLAVEALFEGLLKFFGQVIGPKHAMKYAPYVATLWLFILVNKLAGLIPGLMSPWWEFWPVFGLGITTFVWVNFNAIREAGVRHYFWHLCGSPTAAIGWVMAFIIFPLELIATIVRPVSLSLRLYGNTFGEDKLLASFLGLGMILVSVIFGTPHPPVGVPLHLPFMFLGILGSLIQATVFAMLSAVYIAILLPHDHHEHEAEGAHGEAHAHA